MGGGAEDDLLIVTCIHSGLRWVAPVESLDSMFSMVEVFSGVPDFIVFWLVAFPLSSIFELIVLELRVDDFVEFVFIFSVYLNRMTGFFDLRGELFVLVRFEEGDVEGVVYGQ